MAADFDRDGFLDAAVTRSFVNGPVLLFLGNGRGGFAEPLSFSTPEYPRSLVTGDFNRDGFPDLAFTFSNRPTIGVLIGGAGGRFRATVEYAAGAEPWDLVAADFNGDHVDDLAVILNGSNGTAGVAILLATGTGAFGAPTTFPDGQYPRDVAAADLNHDGNVDLAITNVNENVVSILLGQGDGSFGVRTPFAAPPTVLSVAIGLFNGDAHPDLAVSGGGFLEPAALAILPGNGQGSFGTANVVAPISSYELEVLDFNEDGKDDLAGRWNGVTVLIGNGNGTFQFAPSSGSFARWGLAPGDFNSDGWTDFAVVLQESLDPLALRLYLGGPSGVEKNSTYLGAFDPTAMTVGDFNEDGFSDLAIADGSIRFYPAGSLTLLFGQPAGSLSGLVTHATVFMPTSIRTADFNGDGHLDLACANSNAVSILLGTGTGGFSPATNYPLAPAASAIDTADFNSDAKLDLVFSNSDGVRIAFGDGMGGFGPPSTHPVFGPMLVAGDFNVDGKADVAMLGQMGYAILYGDGMGGFGVVVNVPAGANLTRFIVADFNGDGRPDLAGVSVTEGGSVVLGQAGGGFGGPLPFPAGFNPSALTAGDLVVDGKSDLAIASGDVVSVLRGKGDGTFSPAGDFLAPSGAAVLVGADVNADGRPDLAAVTPTFPERPSASDVTLLLNTNCLARRLAVTRNPAACNLPNAPFEIQPVVKLYDDGDNVVSCVGGSVHASIVPGSGTPGAALGGTTGVPLVSGVASFGDLSVNAAGNGYVLQFSRAGVVSARSRLFRVDTACKGPFAFFTVPPCRVLDTRDPAGPWGAPALAGSSSRRFAIAGKCAIPAEARSVAANLTVVLPGESGYLTLFPAGRTAPLASAINFRPGVVRANNAVLPLGDAGDIEAFCGTPPGSNVDFVLDVVGYFR